MSTIKFFSIFSASAWVSLKQIDAVARPVFKFAVLVSITTAVIIGMVVNRLADRPRVDVDGIEVPSGEFCCDADPSDAAIVEAFLNRPVATVIYNVVPFRRPVRPAAHPVLDGLNIRDLKKLASAAKIRGYSNLTKDELIGRLKAKGVKVA